MRYLVAVVLLFALIGCQKAPPPYDSKYTEPPTSAVPTGIPVAIIGDSYTGGSDLGGYGTRGWPALVEVRLQAQGIDIVPSVGAEGGSGYVKPGKDGTVFANRVPQVVGPNTQLVVFFGSRNDEDNKAPTAQFAPAVRRTFADVKAVSPNAKILVIGPVWPTSNPPASIIEARDALRSEAAAIGATFVDPIAEVWFVDRPDLIGADGIHPTNEGHVYMADKIEPLIAQQLG